jgi:hypothetical protein
MRHLKRLSGLHTTALLLVLIALFTSGVLPTFAQQDLTETYSDDVVTFSYPEEWFKCTCPDTENTLALGNTEEAPNTDDLQRDEVQVLVVKSAAVFMDEMFELELIAETPEEVLQYFGFEEDELDLYEFDDDRFAAAGYLENDEQELESMFLAIELGDGNFGMFIATTRPRDLSQFEDTILDIASTFIATEAGSSNAGKAGSLGTRRDDNEDVHMADTLMFDDGSFELGYPEDWTALEDEGVAILVNDEDVLELEKLSDLADDELLIFVYPTIDTLPDYDFPVDEGTVPSTIVSYYASMAMIFGMEQQGPMGEPEIGDGDLLASNYYSILDGEYDEYVLAIEDGEGDITTLIAYSAPEQMPEFEAILQEIAATFQAQ